MRVARLSTLAILLIPALPLCAVASEPSGSVMSASEGAPAFKEPLAELIDTGPAGMVEVTAPWPMHQIE